MRLNGYDYLQTIPRYYGHSSRLLIVDIAIDDLLKCEGASDKRTLILSASDVVKVANESGETRPKRGPGKNKKKRSGSTIHH